MDWQDEGMIVGVRPHAETAAIVEVLTRTHGRHAGVVHGGASRKKTPILQPGNQVQVDWRARLEEHLGTYHVELTRSRSAILANRRALAGLGSVCALICFALPERMDLPGIYHRTTALVDAMLIADDSWVAEYAVWELHLLEDLGYGLDLSACAATGTTQDLAWVSPKSGRAVSRAAGAAYADRLLPLPRLLRTGDAGAGVQGAEVLDALRTTGYFLERWLAPALGNRPLPGARDRLVAALRRHRGRQEREDTA